MSPNCPRTGDDDEPIETGEGEGDPETYRSSGGTEHVFFFTPEETDRHAIGVLTIAALKRAKTLGIPTQRLSMYPLQQYQLGSALYDARKDSTWIASANATDLIPFFNAPLSSPSDWDDHGTNPGANQSLQSLLKTYRHVLETGTNEDGEAAIIAHMPKELEPHWRDLLSAVITRREVLARNKAIDMGLTFEALALYKKMTEWRNSETLVGLRIPTEEDIVYELKEVLISDRIIAPKSKPKSVVALDSKTPPAKKWFRVEPALHVTGIVAVVGTMVYLQMQEVNSESSSEPIVSATTLSGPAVAPLSSSSSVQAVVPFTPVYTSVVRQTAEGPDKDLRIAVANEWIVDLHGKDAHDWTDIRQTHPWREDPKALKDLLRKLKGWGGFKNPLLAYESAKARGEAPQSISGFLNLVDNDPQLANGTALRIAREIPLIVDEDINSDLKRVEGGHRDLNGYVELMVLAVQDEYDGGKIQRQADVEYVVPEPPQAPRINLNKVGSIANMDDLPDLTDELEPLDEAPVLASMLTDLKAEVSASTEGLYNKSRGANRGKIRAFNEEFEVAIQAFAEKVPSMTVAEQRMGIYELKAKRFELLEDLNKVDGKYSNYLREPIAREMQALAKMEALLPSEGGVDGAREHIGNSVLATATNIFHEGPRRRKVRA